MAARQMDPLGEIWLAPGYSTEYLRFFLATGLYPAPLEQDEDEFIAVEAIPYEKALEMAAKGEIKDGKTLAGLQMLQSGIGIDFVFILRQPAEGSGSKPRSFAIPFGDYAQDEYPTSSVGS